MVSFIISHFIEKFGITFTKPLHTKERMKTNKQSATFVSPGDHIFYDVVKRNCLHLKLWWDNKTHVLLQFDDIIDFAPHEVVNKTFPENSDVEICSFFYSLYFAVV